MLVLSRKAGEALLIGDGIEVRVLGVGANRVSIGITAESDVNIVRSELLSRAERKERSVDGRTPVVPQQAPKLH